MRSRFALTETPDRLAAAFGATASSTTGWKPSYKFGPARKIIIVRDQSRQPGDACTRELVTASWGFTPVWHSGEVPPTLRVGMERLAQNGFFRDAFLQRRCLVPMLGFYDWQTRPNGTVQSYFVRGEGTVLAAMGIYNVRESKGRQRLSVTLVTRDTGATGDDRVPSILGEAEWNDWLDPEPVNDSEALLQRVSENSHAVAETLVEHPVADSINSPYARDAVSLITPLRRRA
ncbi:MAG: response-associated peptidase [Subtercola sp.]|jgi:putative SOS response-associated peptidase YedK|nr:response-associated peptidase [Subtercola sp.]